MSQFVAASLGRGHGAGMGTASPGGGTDVMPAVVGGHTEQKGAQRSLAAVATQGARQGEKGFVQQILGPVGVAEQA